MSTIQNDPNHANVDSIKSINFIRGGLGLTVRPPDQAPEWASEEIKMDIFLVGAKPISVLVRKFIPLSSDRLDRAWIDDDGEKRLTQLPPYALSNRDSTKLALEEFIESEYLCLLTATDAYASAKLLETLHELHRHSRPRKLIETSARFFFCNRWTTGSAYIGSKEKLDIQPVNDPTYPVPNGVSVPRPVVDSLSQLLNELQAPLQDGFLSLFDEVLRGDSRDLFYAALLVMFIALHQAEHIIWDRYRYARENSMETFYDQPQYVEALRRGLQLLLRHWHAFSGRLNVLWEDRDRLENSLHFLPESSRSTVVEIYNRCKKDHSWPEEEWLVSMVFKPNFTERLDGIWPAGDDCGQEGMTRRFLARRKFRRAGDSRSTRR